MSNKIPFKKEEEINDDFKLEQVNNKVAKRMYQQVFDKPAEYLAMAKPPKFELMNKKPAKPKASQTKAPKSKNYSLDLSALAQLSL